ncbi:hypothetical protein [Streptomyces sp. NPDC054794]
MRASARAVGLDTDEDARVLGRLLGTARGKAVPDALLEAATAPLADHPQGLDVQGALLDLFPDTRYDAAAWLRLLAGTVETGRRARAGRTVSVRGEWQSLDAPHLPLEARRLPAHVAWGGARPPPPPGPPGGG